MKSLKVSFLFFCLCILNVYAQDNLLYHGIQQAKSDGEKFEPVSVFTLVSKSALKSKKVEDYFLNPQEVYFLHYSRSAAKNIGTSMTLSIPLGSRNLQLELQEYTMGYQITTSDNQKISPNKNNRHYHGIVKDDPNSIVAITFGEDEIIGLVATDDGHFNLALDRQSGEHIFYNDKNMKQKLGFTCGTQIDNYPDVYSPEILLQSTRATVTQKWVQFYFETTFDIFQARGSVANVETFITGLYNQVAVLYRNEGISTILSEIHVWNTQDPFANIVITNNDIQNLLDYMERFQQIRTTFNGDLGQLVTFRNLGVTILGGIAAGFDGLCNSAISQRLSVAQIANVNNFPNVPTYSESVKVATHEFGHLFGSRHTHACVWNGNNTAIDGCVPVEGTCSRPGMPSNGGTIMSYCDQQSVGANFNLGFGPQPGNVIRNSVANATCLPTITGPAAVCPGSSGTFTAHNFPGAVTWTCSSNLTILSSNENTATVTNDDGLVIMRQTSDSSESDDNNSQRGLPPLFEHCDKPSWVRASITGTPISVWKDLISGLYCINSLTVMDNGTTPTGNKIYTIVPMIMEGAALTWSWTMPNGNINVWDEGGYSFKFDINPYLTVKVTASSNNVCGTSLRSVSISSTRGGMLPIVVYPNPVSDILNIEIDAEAIAQAKALEQTLTDDKPLKTDPTYDIRLYDGQGNLLRQRKTKGGAVQFNVSNLLNGIYYLHIYDGISDTPEMRQIVVEH